MEERYIDRRTKADRYLPNQLSIVAKLFDGPDCHVATDQQDWDGTDCWVGETAVALRVRFPTAKRYDDFTIRRIELPKIIHGRTKYMLYCQAKDNGQTEKLVGWKLIDLDSIRRAKVDFYEGVRYELRSAFNDDEFWTFNLDDLESRYGPCVVASGEVTNSTSTSTDEDGRKIVTTTRTVTETFHPAFPPPAIAV